ncbi:MAG: alpha-galactosidase [Anaerolineales bacterium]|nr:alpha-galactosidase [Anaerolineales bacterium]
MIAFANPQLRFFFDPQTGTWGLVFPEAEAAALEGARMTVAYREGARRTEWICGPVRCRPAKTRRDPFHGPCRLLAAEADADGGLTVRMEWALPAARPFLLWRMILTNRGTRPLRIDSIGLCRAGPRFAAEGGVRLPMDPARRTMFVNGWQTWSFAGGRRGRDRQPTHKLGPINASMHIGTDVQTSRRPGHFVSDMFAALGGESGGELLVAGFLAQREQFGIVETWLGDGILSLRIEADADGVRLDPEKSLATDRAFLALGRKASAAEYFDAAARENRARTRRAAPDGWGSWYYYYSQVRQTDLETNTDAAKALRPKLPLELIQLDDGFQADVGDWFERNEKFPSPMPELSARIRKAGFLPGIWLAPFILRMDSRTAREHPDWVAPGSGGVMSNVAVGAVRRTRSLDVTRPEVLAHIRRLIRTAVIEWKFHFLKLDFLYHPAAKGTRYADPTATRAQALRRALEAVRGAAGEKAFLLGCGCPLGSGIGVFDAMRIGPDVDSVWKPHLFHQVWAGLGDPTVPSAWNAVRNAFARAPLHRRWWWNDPDCLLARDSETTLTRDERRTLAAAIALSGGMILLSDDLSKLSPDAVRLAQMLFPPLHRAADLPGWRGEEASSLAVLPMRGPQGAWWVIGIFNWGDLPADRSVDLRELTGVRGDARAFSLWDERMIETAGGILDCGTIQPHGSILLAARMKSKGVQYAGSNLHFSQGMEVAEWRKSRLSLRAVLNLGREAEGAVWIALPARPTAVRWNGKPASFEQAGEDIWKIPLRLAGKGAVEIRWNPGGRR